MKKLLLTLILILTISSSAWAIGGVNLNDTVEGTSGVSFSETSTGGWDAIEVPATVEYVRHVTIQVHDGAGTVADAREGFLYSFDSDGTDYQYVETELSLSLGKLAGEVLIYIKASAASKEISVGALQ